MAAAGLVAVAAAAESCGSAAPGAPPSTLSCGSSSGAAPGPSPGSWSRSLDRALEEAALTGVLSLSGRKLREFPRAAASRDLTDTVRADLSRNRLSEVPIEACHFVSLESLNLYQNCIRYIPEAILNLQALTFLNISRNQLSTLPAHLCDLPLKVLIASNNKLVSLPEEIGHLRHLTELDVSCNEIQTVPPQIGDLEALRDINMRRNHLVRLPEELAELPLLRLDFSCNKITAIPVCYRNLRHLQMIALENNPLQSPPAQICIKGKIHIFKYLNMQACKITPDLPDCERRPLGFGSCHEELYSGRPYGALDSGFNSVDSGDKRWSGNEPTDEFSDLPLRVAEITKEQRLRRESQYLEARGSLVVTNGGGEHDLDQTDYIDSCAAEEEDEEEDEKRPKSLDTDSLSSQFMAYIEQRRISHESSSVKSVGTRERRKPEDVRKHPHPDRFPVESSSSLSLIPSHYQQKASQSPQKQQCALGGEKDDRSYSVSSSPTTETVHHSPAYSSPATTQRHQPQRPESFLFRTTVRKETSRGHASPLSPAVLATDSTEPLLRQNPKQREEELELIDLLRKHIEYRLKVSLPNDLGAALTDGVVLCHLANHPKLTIAKCRRNVENFLEACRKIGVPQEQLCLPQHILEERGLSQVAATVHALLELAPPKPQSQLQLPAV
ncbi:DISP complex protein LRCH3 isoform X2 [Erinaceus europaeus]|uniref:DISP complex protein LRCH3 isoform X2 n=1 Tax=Erinaceus europaeus TaxID=9365 RepID=A0ABM3VV42_ERIEU|nr:DISP complex protein LRCH3 isoform X2 [Erinaceus europaeus]